MATEESFLRPAVVFGSALVYWGGVLVQARRVRKRIGRSPNVGPRGLREKLLWLGWTLAIVVWMGQPFLIRTHRLPPALQVIPGLVRPAGAILGLVMLVAGYAGTLWCYAAMGDTWRMGVNRAERTALVTRGPYRRVRH